MTLRHPGYYWVICDVCGRRIKSTEIIRNTDKYSRQYGLLVCKDDYDLPNEQATIKVPKERQLNPRYVRPEQSDRYAVYRSIEEIETGQDEADPTGTVPSAPLNLRLYEYDLDASTISIMWDVSSDPGSSPVHGYKIERSYNGVVFSTLIADTNTPALLYIDTSITADSIYEYRIYAINNYGTSAVSNTFTIAFISDGITILTDNLGNFLVTSQGDLLIE